MEGISLFRKNKHTFHCRILLFQGFTKGFLLVAKKCKRLQGAKTSKKDMTLFSVTGAQAPKAPWIRYCNMLFDHVFSMITCLASYIQTCI